MWSTGLLLTSIAGLSSAAFTLEDDYLSGGTFFSRFTFFNTSDPTHGFVQYLNQSAAASASLITQSSTSVYMGVDHTNVQPNGRPSVRITSTKTYDSGLFILDLQHAPEGVCGTWPAFWTVGDNWPTQGEIDIIEGVNDGTTNLMSMHTSEGCQIQETAYMTGTVSTSDCYVDDPNQSSNAGCGITTTNTQTYGSGFNSANGGVYATLYNSTAVTVWFFTRTAITTDIKNGKPTPSGWGKPMALFSGCNISQYVQNQRIVFDTTFCGDWAGNVWSSSSTCSTKASTCSSYVANNPSAFSNSYWSVNSLKVYQGSWI